MLLRSWRFRGLFDYGMLWIRTPGVDEMNIDNLPGHEPATFSEADIILGSIDQYHQSWVEIKVSDVAPAYQPGERRGEISMPEGILLVDRYNEHEEIIVDRLIVGRDGRYGVSVVRSGDDQIVQHLEDPDVDRLNLIESFTLELWRL